MNEINMFQVERVKSQLCHTPQSADEIARTLDMRTEHVYRALAWMEGRSLAHMAPLSPRRRTRGWESA